MSASLLARLIEAGTPAALVAEVAMELGKAEAERAVLAERRKNERERKARSRDITGQDVTERDERDRLPSLDKSPQTPKINPTPLVHTRETRTRGAAWPCPEGVNPDHWRDFMGNRRRKKLANTGTAHAGVLRDLENLTDADWPPGRLVELAAAKGWGSINKPDGYANGRTNSMAGTRGASASGHGTTVDAAQRFLARHTPQFAG